MKVYRVTLMILDFDNVGEQGIIDTLEETRYPNRCISPKVMDIDSADIGPWHDDHPLNKRDTMRDTFQQLFPFYWCH